MAGTPRRACGPDHRAVTVAAIDLTGGAPRVGGPSLRFPRLASLKERAPRQREPLGAVFAAGRLAAAGRIVHRARCSGMFVAWMICLGPMALASARPVSQTSGQALSACSPSRAFAI